MDPTTAATGMSTFRSTLAIGLCHNTRRWAPPTDNSSWGNFLEQHAVTVSISAETVYFHRPVVGMYLKDGEQTVEHDRTMLVKPISIRAFTRRHEA